jgi:ribosomal protein S18 acetylase RimI-like enzyme
LNPAIHCLVVERRDRIVGFITVRAATDGDMSPRRVAEMPTLYVHPAHWRSGLGTALCEAGVRRARTLGFVELVLWVLDINERARHFYASVGFRPDGAAKIDEGTPEAFKAERYRLALAAEET